MWVDCTQCIGKRSPKIWKNEKFTLLTRRKKISSNQLQLFSDFFTFTKFLPKKV